MNTLPEPQLSSDTGRIIAVRKAWLDAVRACDIERLAALVTDDVVVVHGNGRSVHGKNDLKLDLRSGFQRFMIDQVVSSAEIVMRGDWAFEIAYVESVLIPVGGGEARNFASTTVVALARQPDGAWKIGRVIGVSA